MKIDSTARAMRANTKMQLGLQLLIQHITQNAIGIEIGSYAGESAALFAASGKFQTLYCVDPWDPDYYSNHQLIDAEKSFDQVAANHGSIVKCKMTADEFFSQPTLPVDNSAPDNYRGTTHHSPLTTINFIYIDGNHHYDFVNRDISNALKLLKPGAILAGHDYGFHKAPGVKQAVDEILGYPDALFCDTSWMKIIP